MHNFLNRIGQRVNARCGAERTNAQRSVYGVLGATSTVLSGRCELRCLFLETGMAASTVKDAQDMQFLADDLVEYQIRIPAEGFDQDVGNVCLLTDIRKRTQLL
jgi:hypothetical protein